MKIKSGLLIALCLMAIAANAQLSVGIKAGLNISSIEEYEPYSLDSKAGFHGGIVLQYMITGNWGIESGIYYSTMGGKEKEKDYDYPNLIDDYTVTANPSYLQMPLSVIYKVNFNENLSLYPSLGVYFGYGLSGKIEAKGEIRNEDISVKRDFFDKNTNRFDMGGGVGINLQCNRMVFGFGYETAVKFLKNNFTLVIQ